MARSGPPLELAVVGADHLHLFEIVDGLVAAGARTSAHTSEGDFVEAYAGWRPESAEVGLDQILDNPAIDLVVTAGVPCRRAEVAAAAIRAGKAVVSDKPGVTTRAQLDDITAAIAGRPGRPWTVLFTERFENRAISEAVRLARSGAVGRVCQVVGAGPHSMFAGQRAAWFWDPDSTGGIIADIGTHQIDQFLAIAGPDGDPRVLSSTAGNVASPHHPEMQDIARFTLACNGVVGDHRLDYLTAAGLGTWGDARLTVVGTDGTLEARANVDPAGAEGPEHLIVVDGSGTRRVVLDEVPIDWAHSLLADVAEDGESLMSQRHVVDVCALALLAQSTATGWPPGQASL